jgi:hypothetical protein
MATVTGFTAARIAAIEAQAIIGGEVVGEDLILERFNGETFNAGHVRGDPGPVDLEEWLDYADPPGSPKPYDHSVLPARHGWCDALVEFDGDTYPKLAAIYLTGVDCINGACDPGNFRLPDYRGKFFVARHSGIAAFDTLRETGGSKDAAIVNHVHPHDHDGTTVANGDPHTHEIDHNHGVNAGVGTGDQILVTETGHEVAAGGDYPAATGYSGGTTGPSPDAVSGPASDSSHDHTFTTDSDSTNPTGGVSGVDKNLPPYRVVNVIMRLT